MCAPVCISPQKGLTSNNDALSAFEGTVQAKQIAPHEMKIQPGNHTFGTSICLYREKAREQSNSPQSWSWQQLAINISYWTATQCRC